MEEFNLNINGIDKPKIITAPLRISPEDADIYDMRRQIEARQNVKDYIKTEIFRLQQLLDTLTHEITVIDLELRNRKPNGEPRNKKYLYAPGTTHMLTNGEGNAIEGEIV
jgi:hypothetical protein